MTELYRKRILMANVMISELVIFHHASNSSANYAHGWRHLIWLLLISHRSSYCMRTGRELPSPWFGNFNIAAERAWQQRGAFQLAAASGWSISHRMLPAGRSRIRQTKSGRRIRDQLVLWEKPDQLVPWEKTDQIGPWEKTDRRGRPKPVYQKVSI